MTSELIRDPIADHLITPENSALILIDYQPTQFSSVRSMDPDLLLKNAVTTVKAAKLFGLPIVHSTVNVSSGQNKPTVAELAELLEDSPAIDRTSINSWEDVDFVAAVRATAVDSSLRGNAADHHVFGIALGVVANHLLQLGVHARRA